jgi:hypothetical protein
VEEQAIDRVHRLNQTVDVKIYKMTVNNTVEARILALQDRKRELANAAIEGKTAAAKLTMRDMMALFGREAEARFEHEHDVGVDLTQKTRLLKSAEDDDNGNGTYGDVWSLPSSSQSSAPGAGGRRENDQVKKPATRVEDPVYGRKW